MIKFLVMDVDGTLTDGHIYMSNEGEWIKAFNIKDGYGIHDLLIPAGIVPVIITGRTSGIVERRCAELGIRRVYQGIDDKCRKLRSLTEDLSEVSYIGDDINDLPCMHAVKRAGGAVGCPADAVTAVKDVSDFICAHKGGDGAVRDFIDWIIARNNL